MSTLRTARLVAVSIFSALVAWGCGGGGGGYGGGSSTPAPAVDTTAPSTVAGLGATAASATQINLTWTAATDNVAVTGYRIERCSGAACTTFSQIATPTATTYSDTGLTASTSYSYRIRAVDAAGNVSASYSTVATVSTQAPPAVGSVSGTVIALKTRTPVAGAQVSIGSLTTTTAANGTFSLSQVPVGNSVLVHVDPPPASFAETFRLVRVTANTNTDVPALAVVPTGVTVAVNVAAGATINVGTGRVVIPPNALVPKTGGAAAATVNVSVTPVSAVNDPQSLPGEYTVAVSGGAMQPFRSYGAMLVDLRDANGVHYTLSPGMTASIRIPVATLKSAPYPATLALLSFNETTGKWVEEPGLMTLNAGGTYYEGTVSHFTYYHTVGASGCPVPHSASLSTCNPSGPHTVDGRMVTANGAPLANVRVFLLGVNYSGLNDLFTDSTGRFSFIFQPDEVSLLWAASTLGRTGAFEVRGSTDISLGDVTLITDANNLRATTIWNRKDTLAVRSYMTVPNNSSGDIGGPDDAGAIDADPFGFLQRNDPLQYHAVTVQRLYVGRYRYFIDPTIAGDMSAAQMSVYIEASKSPTFTVIGAPLLANNGDMWHPFDAIVAADCSVQIIFTDELINAGGQPPAGPPDSVGTGQLCTPP